MITTEQRQARTYTFGPLERRGVMLGVRLGHLILFAVGMAAVLSIFNVAPNAVGAAAVVVLLAALGVVALLPVGGRALDEWAVVTARHLTARVARRTRWVSSEAVVGHRVASGTPLPGAPSRDPRGDGDGVDESWISGVRRVDGRRSVPSFLRGVELWGAQWGDGEIGVIRDAEWQRWSAVIAVRGRSFALADRGEKEARLDDWSRVLAGLARERSPLVRLQWLERTVPDDSDSVVRDFGERRIADHESPAVRSYLALLDGVGLTTQQHELYLVLTVGERQLGSSAQRRGSRRLDACEVLAHEVDGVSAALAEAGLLVLGVLGVRPLARLLRVSFDPGAAAGLAHRAAAAPEHAGAVASDAYPQACQEWWGEMRADGAFHRTYWVSELPRTEVGADLMVPLLLRTPRQRTVSLVMAIDAPSRAVRRAQAQRHGDTSTEATRQRLGFTASSARRQREQEGAVRRECELASGHAALRFSAYITVSGRTRAELEAGCADVERQARASGLEVRAQYGMQGGAFTFTLPLGRGLR